MQRTHKKIESEIEGGPAPKYSRCCLTAPDANKWEPDTQEKEGKA